jgi:hypothetical protein
MLLVTADSDNNDDEVNLFQHLATGIPPPKGSLLSQPMHQSGSWSAYNSIATVDLGPTFHRIVVLYINIK